MKQSTVIFSIVLGLAGAGCSSSSASGPVASDQSKDAGATTVPSVDGSAEAQSGSDGSASDRQVADALSNFTGAAWGTAASTQVDTCGDASTMTIHPSYGPETFVASGTSGLTNEWTEGGCTFAFSVSGNTATLSNGPVACTMGAYSYSFTSYTLTSDGSTLSATFAGTYTVSGSPQACTFSETATVARSR